MQSQSAQIYGKLILVGLMFCYNLAIKLQNVKSNDLQQIQTAFMSAIWQSVEWLVIDILLAGFSKTCDTISHKFVERNSQTANKLFSATGKTAGRRLYLYRVYKSVEGAGLQALISLMAGAVAGAVSQTVTELVLRATVVPNPPLNTRFIMQ